MVISEIPFRISHMRGFCAHSRTRTTPGAMMTNVAGGDDFLLDKRPFSRYEIIAKGKWYEQHGRRESAILWPGVHRRRVVVDPGCGRELWRDQPAGAGSHGVRTFAWLMTA